jgi:ELWxxDGT repeat protein
MDRLPIALRRAFNRRVPNRRRRLHLLGMETLESRDLLAVSTLLEDIHTGPESSDMGSMVRMGDYAYFAANGGDTGVELWRTDGTEGGTSLVRDIQPGSSSSSPEQLVVIGSYLYFTAMQSSTGRELWRTDGTSDGTVLVKDISAGSTSSAISGMTAVGGQLLFSAFGSSAAQELWRSDGTEAGTVLVKDIWPGGSSSSPAQLTHVNGMLYFTATTSGEGRELWKSDGTESGTELVRDITPGVSSTTFNHLTAVGDALFFAATSSAHGQELWTSDGSLEGTVLVKDIYTGVDSSSPAEFFSHQGVLFFSATTALEGRELWRSDGTDTGTYLIHEIRSGTSSSNPAGLVAHQSEVYFVAQSASEGRELWRTDGTSVGTVLVKDIVPGGTSSLPEGLTSIGDWLYFSATLSSTGRELWRTDGTVLGTELLHDVAVGAIGSNPGRFMEFPSAVLFAATTPQLGNELWKTDGTASGLTLVKNINPNTQSSSPSQFIGLDGTTFFIANHPLHGVELFRSEGTAESTGLVRDIRPGTANSNPNSLTRFGDQIIFAASDGVAGVELWTSDGTEHGTQMVRDIQVGNTSSSPTLLTVVDSTVYFVATTAAEGQELWKSDGTALGTTLVADLRPGALGSNPQRLLHAGGVLYFTADQGDAGRELWKSDGTPQGTVQVKDIRAGSGDSSPENLIALGNQVFFTADDGIHGRELWVTDGTEGGTVLVKDIRSGSGSATPLELVALGNRILFTAFESTSGRELWVSDGTPEGTTLVRNLASGNASPEISGIQTMGNHVYFSAWGAATGQELWRSDGTFDGTVLVADIRSGSGSSSPGQLVAVGGTLFFVADDGNHGRELWLTDGTAAGTELARDIFPGGDGSSLANMRGINGMLAYAANDGLHGTEPWLAMVGDSPRNVYLDSDEIAENQPVGTVVGTFSTIDATPNDAHQYHLVPGTGDTDNARFTIAGDQLIAAEVFDFEQQSEFHIRVRTTDLLGHTLEKIIAVYLTDLNDAPELAQVDTLIGVGIHAPYALHYAELLELSDATDQDNDAIHFRVESVLNGTLTSEGAAVIPGESLLGPGQYWVWTPPADWEGLLPFMDIVAWDGIVSSSQPVSVLADVVPWSLSLGLDTEVMSEADGPIGGTATISRIGDLTVPLVITLANQDRTEWSLPSTVTIPANAKSVTISIRVVNDGEVDGDQVASMDISAQGYSDQQASVTVLDDDTSEYRTLGGDLFGSITPYDYTVLTDIRVWDGDVLSIAPGSRLFFTSGTRLEVPETSKLLAQGTESSWIVFTSAAASPMPGDWGGLLMATKLESHSLLEYVEIGYATIGIQNEAYDSARFLLNHSKVHHSSQDGVRLQVGYGADLFTVDVQILNSQIAENGAAGIAVVAYGSSGSPPANGSNAPRIASNRIWGNTSGISVLSSYGAFGGLVGGAYASPEVSGNWIHNNQTGISGHAVKPSGSFGSSWVAGKYVNNLIVDNQEYGMRFLRSSGSLGPQIINNTIANHPLAGIYHDALFSSISESHLRNNLVIANGHGIQAAVPYVPETSRVGFNNVWGSLGSDWLNYPDSFGQMTTSNANGTPADAEMNLSVDPQWLEGADSSVPDFYRPLVTSEVINAGTSLGAPLADYSGVAREGTPDIGAWETIPVPPELSVSIDHVIGIEGATLANSGTWQDTNLGDSVALSASVGAVEKHADGTWTWSLGAEDDATGTEVMITAVDSAGLEASVTFSFSVANAPPNLTQSQTAMVGNVLSNFSNSGTWSDVPSDTVTLSASLGEVVKNGDGTWSWSMTPSQAYTSQLVTITASDEDGGTSHVSFTIDALVAVVNRRVFYNASGFETVGGVGAALDASKILLRSSSVAQATTAANVINYSRGINGVVLDVAGLAGSGLSASDFLFRVAPSGASGVVNPSTWASAPTPNVIDVTPGTSTTPARVRLEWANNAIQNTWLQIIVLANANTGLANREVYYLGHSLGDVDYVGPTYRVTTNDVALVRAGVSSTPVGISDARDVDKDRRVTTNDVAFVRGLVSNTPQLRAITIPASGSSEEGEGGTGGLMAAPGVVLPQSGVEGVRPIEIKARMTGSSYDVPLPAGRPSVDAVWQAVGAVDSVGSDRLRRDRRRVGGR